MPNANRIAKAPIVRVLAFGLRQQNIQKTMIAQRVSPEYSERNAGKEIKDDRESKPQIMVAKKQACVELEIASHRLIV